jgi:hypothetical protein
MSSDRVIKDLYIDTEGTQIRSYKNTTFYALSPDMTMFRGTQVLFRCHLMMADAVTYFAPPAGATWLFGIDSEFTADHTDLVVSLNDKFIAADWDQASFTGGKICWRADLTSQALKDKLADQTAMAMYACLWMTPSGGNPTLMAQWNITMKNIAVDPTTATVQEGITYPTTEVFNSSISEIKTPTGGIYRLQNGALQLWNATQSKWHTLSISGAAGEETLDIGPGEA